MSEYIALSSNTGNDKNTYFDEIPSVIQYQNHEFKVKSKEMVRKQIFDDFEESQTILIKVITLNE